jgi:hypothetical protein
MPLKLLPWLLLAEPFQVLRGQLREVLVERGVARSMSNTSCTPAPRYRGKLAAASGPLGWQRDLLTASNYSDLSSAATSCSVARLLPATQGLVD